MRMAAKWLRQGPGAAVLPDAPPILPAAAVSVNAGRENWGAGAQGLHWEWCHFIFSSLASFELFCVRWGDSWWESILIEELKLHAPHLAA